ncbi:unnamed protein product [Prorocentrum cordatum]|uniref:Uncharacterized protein n=1 Tax=Prorocentrum cordatum TaxID=2364126 RepID=A0ABN9VIF0_9DINO|nr:unnamed protein product [Polarella glacialis]CAK0873006.1 unnamed protein product [Polarella glacialis]
MNGSRGQYQSPPGGMSRQQQQQQPQTPGGGGGTMFYNVGMQLSGEMVNQLTVEHANETHGLYEQIVALRTELSRTMELMQGFVNREKALHEMVDQLQSAFAGATQGVMDAHGQFHAMSKDGSMKPPDPVADAQAELQRIKQILSTPAIPAPDVPPHLQQLVR